MRRSRCDCRSYNGTIGVILSRARVVGRTSIIHVGHQISIMLPETLYHRDDALQYIAYHEYIGIYSYVLEAIIDRPEC